VPANFVVSAILAFVIGLRLRHLRATQTFVADPLP
jgi:hypothetical protein